MENQFVTQVVLNEGEVLTKKKAQVRQPNFYKIGNGTMNKHGIKAVDLLDILMDCSRPAQHVFRLIKSRIVWCPYEQSIQYIVKVARKDFTKAEEKRFDRGIKELLDLGLVRRLRPSHYMINPNALIPYDYPKYLKVWEKAGGKKLSTTDVDTYLIDDL